MRDWRNGQTRTFKGRVGDRVSSSLTSRTKRTNTNVLVLFYCKSRIPQGRIGGILRLRSVAFAYFVGSARTLRVRHHPKNTKKIRAPLSALIFLVTPNILEP